MASSLSAQSPPPIWPSLHPPPSISPETASSSTFRRNLFVVQDRDRSPSASWRRSSRYRRRSAAGFWRLRGVILATVRCGGTRCRAPDAARLITIARLELRRILTLVGAAPLLDVGDDFGGFLFSLKSFEFLLISICLL